MQVSCSEIPPSKANRGKWMLPVMYMIVTTKIQKRNNLTQHFTISIYGFYGLIILYYSFEFDLVKIWYRFENESICLARRIWHTIDTSAQPGLLLSVQLCSFLVPPTGSISANCTRFSVTARCT